MSCTLNSRRELAIYASVLAVAVVMKIGVNRIDVENRKVVATVSVKKSPKRLAVGAVLVIAARPSAK